MMDPDVAIDIAFIRAKMWLSITLAIGGMLTLIVGLLVLLGGVTGQDHTLIRFSGVEVSASGIGGVIMVTSVVWAFVAYKARPIYSRVHHSSRKFDANRNLIEEIDEFERTIIRRP